MKSSHNSSSTKPLYRIIQIIWYLLALLQVFLAFRFILKLTGANSAAGFTSFIYSATRPFVAPFLAVFSTTTAQGSIFEWTTLLAMLTYWLVTIGIVRLFLMGKTVSTPEAAEKLEEQEEQN